MYKWIYSDDVWRETINVILCLFELHVAWQLQMSQTGTRASGTIMVSYGLSKYVSKQPVVFMMTSSNENIFRVTGRCPVNSPPKGQWHGTLIFSLIGAWINGWVNNREAGDLRRHRAHYDVIVMHLVIICLTDDIPYIIFIIVIGICMLFLRVCFVYIQKIYQYRMQVRIWYRITQSRCLSIWYHAV